MSDLLVIGASGAEVRRRQLELRAFLGHHEIEPRQAPADPALPLVFRPAFNASAGRLSTTSSLRFACFCLPTFWQHFRCCRLIPRERQADTPTGRLQNFGKQKHAHLTSWWSTAGGAGIEGWSERRVGARGVGLELSGFNLVVPEERAQRELPTATSAPDAPITSSSDIDAAIFSSTSARASGAMPWSSTTGT